MSRYDIIAPLFTPETALVMTNILILDASSSLCSVSLLSSGQTHHLCEDQPRRHAQRLLPMVDEILKAAEINKSELNGIAYGRGPGSFTGIRIAASVMQGIALALNLPVYGVSSLQAIAQQLVQQQALNPGQEIAAIMDAHMGEVFWGIFRLQENGLVTLQGQEQVATPERCIEQLAEFNGVFAGDGLTLEALEGQFPDERSFVDVLPKTEYMTSLVADAWDKGQFGNEEQHAPVYLRDSVAWKKLDEQPSLLKR